jgi:Na+/glutamate symporter
MRWIGLVFGVVAGTILAAYLSAVVEVDRARMSPVDEQASG